MKKITFILAFIGMIGLQSCSVNEVNDNVDNDTIAEVWEYSNDVNFTPNNNFSLLIPFRRPIFSSDMILVYRLSGVDNGNDVWKLLPETYYFNDGTLDFGYDFDFTKNNFFIRIIGNDLITLQPQFRLNQVLRVVVIPGYFGGRMATQVDFKDYNATIKAFNVDTKNIKK